MKRLFAALAMGVTLLLGVTSCETLQQFSTVQQAANTPINVNSVKNKVLIAQYSYTAAGKVAAAYVELPRCGRPTSPIMCSHQAMVDQIRRLNVVAYAAVTKAADAVERLTPGATVGSAVMVLVDEASDAVADLTKIADVTGLRI